MTPARAKKSNTAGSYTADQIQVLEGLEAVRRRPGMYIGSTDQRGLHHLIYEIVDNSIDEAMAGYCDRVEITIHADESVTVSDNGRGIPVDIHEKTRLSGVETILTTLHAGGKFGGGGYQVSGGLHGVGASVVNALSSRLDVTVRVAAGMYQQSYEYGEPLAPLKRVERRRQERTGTTIRFLPGANVFQSLDYDFGVLATRFREMAYLTSKVRIIFLDERVAAGELPREMSFYFDSGVRAFVRHLNRGRKALHDDPVYITETADDGMQVEIALQYNAEFAEHVYAFANGIHTIDGGSHLTGFRSALTRVLNEYGRRARLLKDTEINLTGEDVREGLAAVIAVRIPDPQFEGQTKTRARQSGSEGVRRIGRHEQAGGGARRDASAWSRDHRQGRHGAARSRRRAQGAYPRAAQGHP